MKAFALSIIVFMYFAILHTACVRNSAATKPVLDHNLLSQHIETVCNTHYDSTKLIESQISVFYKSNSFQTIWHNEILKHNRLDSLYKLISNAEKQGLSPTMFYYNELKQHIENTDTLTFNYDKMAIAEYYASFAFLQYISVMYFGIIQPQTQLSNYYFATQQANAEFLQQALIDFQKKGFASIENYTPQNKLYNVLIQKRANYQSIPDAAYASIPLLLDGTTIKHNTQHPIVTLIAERLKASNHLSEKYVNTPENQLFDDNLLQSVNAFQHEMGLIVDKEIGNNTLRTLNLKPSDMIAKIDANLERLRWKLQQPLGPKHIIVNVAEMQLRAYNADTLALQSVVCVGRPRNRTPMLQSNIHELVLNPTWTIPSSIIVNDISKTMQRDTNYISRMRMRIYHKNEEVKPQDVNWASIRKNHQPYIIVQDSGDINALGRIKFNFANRHSVYLHDTNSKGAFARHNRALSHGCVRVQKPLELAFFCLAPIDKTQKAAVEKRDLLHDKIRHSIALKPRTKIGKAFFEENTDTLTLDKVRLRPAIPLLIMYQTARIMDDGKLGFVPDIYDMDTELSSILAKLDKALK